MNAAQLIPIIAITVCCSFALYFFIVDFLTAIQHAKNKTKQEAKERAEVNDIFEQAPTGFLQRSCEERCYEAFDKQMKEVFN